MTFYKRGIELLCEHGLLSECLRYNIYNFSLARFEIKCNIELSVIYMVIAIAEVNITAQNENAGMKWLACVISFIYNHLYH